VNEAGRENYAARCLPHKRYLWLRLASSGGARSRV